MNNILIPFALAVLPTSVSDGEFFSFIAALTVLSATCLYAGALEPDARFAKAPAVAALYAAARSQRRDRSLPQTVQPSAIAVR